MRIHISKITEMLTSNKGLKILSLLIAIVSWYGIKGVTEPPTQADFESARAADPHARHFTMEMPIHLMTVSASNELDMKASPRSVRITLETALNYSKSNVAEEVSAFVDCAGITESGKYTRRVNCISSPKHKVVDISPKTAIVYCSERDPNPAADTEGNTNRESDEQNL